MKALNEIAILMVVVSIIIGYFINKLTVGDLIFRIFLIVGNIIYCSALDER